MEVERINAALLEACKQIVWKLSHNHDLPDYKGPARITREDATVKMAVAAIANAQTEAYAAIVKADPAVVDILSTTEPISNSQYAYLQTVERSARSLLNRTNLTSAARTAHKLPSGTIAPPATTGGSERMNYEG